MLLALTEKTPFPLRRRQNRRQVDLEIKITVIIKRVMM